GAAWLDTREGNVLDPGTGRRLAETADLLCEIWRNADAGIWEIDPARYTSSKLGCWAALDRALRLADDAQLPGDHAARWRQEEEAIRGWIERDCWSARRRTHV